MLSFNLLKEVVQLNIMSKPWECNSILQADIFFPILISIDMITLHLGANIVIKEKTKSWLVIKAWYT